MGIFGNPFMDHAIKLSLGVQTFRFGSIRGLSFFEKKTQFEVQVFSVKKLEPRIELIFKRNNQNLKDSRF
jgi:hypothetical protein